MDGEKQISWILAFIRKYLKLEQQDALFLYVNQAFSPSPDQVIRLTFGTNKITINITTRMTTSGVPLSG